MAGDFFVLRRGVDRGPYTKTLALIRNTDFGGPALISRQKTENKLTGDGRGKNGNYYYVKTHLMFILSEYSASSSQSFPLDWRRHSITHLSRSRFTFQFFSEKPENSCRAAILWVLIIFWLNWQIKTFYCKKHTHGFHL